MKYIRTEKLLIVPWNREDTPNFKLDKFLGEADTIEELCDDFVLIDKNEYKTPISEELIGKRYRAMFDEFTFRLSEGSDICKMAFYGAIWTDRGLIYVAKINEKGELELLS